MQQTIEDAASAYQQQLKQPRINAPGSKPTFACRSNCPVCGGLGYVRYNVPIGHERFGKVFHCPQLPADSAILENHGLTSEERQRMTWARINPRESVRAGIQAIQAVMKRGTGMVYLHGGPGLAKTLLLKTACAEWARQGGKIFHYATLPDLLDELRQCYSDPEQERALAEKRSKYAAFPFLAVDELGGERETGFAVEETYKLLNARHEAGTERAEGVLTLLAGNVPPARLHFRIADRLADGRNVIVELTGESLRPGLTWMDI